MDVSYRANTTIYSFPPTHSPAIQPISTALASAPYGTLTRLQGKKIPCEVPNKIFDWVIEECAESPFLPASSRSNGSIAAASWGTISTRSSWTDSPTRQSLEKGLINLRNHSLSHSLKIQPLLIGRNHRFIPKQAIVGSRDYIMANVVRKVI